MAEMAETSNFDEIKGKDFVFAADRLHTYIHTYILYLVSQVNKTGSRWLMWTCVTRPTQAVFRI